MDWKPIDFHGIIALDTPLIDLLHRYLDEKEEQLSSTILEAIPPPTVTLQPPVAATSAFGHLKLADAIETLVKRNYQNSQSPYPQPFHINWKNSIAKINAALWNYVETIEGCIAELFQQLEQTSIEQWHPRLSDVVSSIKEMLIHRTEDLIWGIKRLEHLLRKAQLASETHTSWHFIKELSSLWTPLLDRSLTSNLKKSQEFLRTQHQKFAKRYKSYLKLQEQVDHSLEKFSEFHVLQSLETETQEQFKKLYQLVKLWELNHSAKSLPAKELIIALRNALSIDKATGLFKDYYTALNRSLFDKSLDFKVHSNELMDDPSNKLSMQEAISSCQNETRMLGATISHYREFQLSSDPDPYVRTRLGFSEWIVGPEPMQTKPLLQLGYDVESLNELYEQLSHSLRRGIEQRVEISDVDREIQQHVHEMGQPLATHRMMRSGAEKVLDKVQQLDELGSFEIDVIDYIGKVFSKLLRADWRYHVLHGIPLFHQLYATHQGLVKPVEDRHHNNRLTKFKKLLQQVHEWVKNNKTQMHFHDIELDMSDIKGYLQDFLGYVQRTSSDPSLSKEKALELHREIAQQLLEYRYLFGNFFYQLRQHETEGQFIRKQCLFVDQYFETIEAKLYELERANHGSQISVEDQDTQDNKESESQSEEE